MLHRCLFSSLILTIIFPVAESLRTRHAERLAAIRAEENKEDNNLQPDDEAERKAEQEFEALRRVSIDRCFAAQRETHRRTRWPTGLFSSFAAGTTACGGNDQG